MTSLTSLTAVLSVALVAAQEGPAPEDVKAGWLGLVVWLALAAAVVFLAFSLRKHLKKVDFDEGPDDGPGDGSGGGTGDPNGSRTPHGSTG
jgi:ABC-type nitrate/sulfonate/bicarbonate transport system substrate-binding protein